MPDIQQALLDFDSTIKAKPNLTNEELMAKFPEFNNDLKLIQSAHDYSATLNSGKYDSHIEVNSKFPEFFSMPTPGGIPIPKEMNSGGQSGPLTDQKTIPTEKIPETNTGEQSVQQIPLSDIEAKKVLNGNIPGTTKIGDVSLPNQQLTQKLINETKFQNDKGVITDQQDLLRSTPETFAPTTQIKIATDPQLEEMDKQLLLANPDYTAKNPISTIPIGETKPKSVYDDYKVEVKGSPITFNPEQEAKEAKDQQELNAPAFSNDNISHLWKVFSGTSAGMFSGIGKGVNNIASLILENDPYTVHDANYEKLKGNITKSNKELSDWQTKSAPKLAGTFGESIVSAAPMVGLVGADMLSGGALTPATVTAFALMGSGEGLQAIDDYSQTTGKQFTQAQRQAASVGYMLAYTLPIGKYLEKFIPKDAGKYIMSKVLTANPELMMKAGADIIEAAAKQSPTLVQKIINTSMKSAVHGVGTMEAIDLVKMATDKMVMDKGVTMDEFTHRLAKNAESGLIFGLATMPFATYAGIKGNETRRNAQRELTFALDEKGKAVEILPSKEGKVQGMRPDGSIVDVTQSMLENSVTMTTSHFNEVVKGYKDSKLSTKQADKTISDFENGFNGNDSYVRSMHDEYFNDKNAYIEQKKADAQSNIDHYKEYINNNPLEEKYDGMKISNHDYYKEQIIKNETEISKLNDVQEAYKAKEAGNKQVLGENFDRDTFVNRLAQSLKKVATSHGNITTAKDSDGNNIYVKGKNENGELVGIDSYGKEVTIPGDSPTKTASIGDVHQSIMSEYDKSRNYDPRESYQQAIENTNPETVVNPTIPVEVDVTDPTSHIQSGISVIQAKQAMDKQLEGSGITFSEEVVKSDPEMQKRVLDEVMQDTELSDIQKESIVSYVAAEAKARKLQEADRANTETQIQQAGQNLVINPTTNTVVTVRLKGTDEKTPPFVIKSGLSVILDENGEHAVDLTNSDESVYYVDADGNTQVTTADNLDIVTNTTPEESMSVIQSQLMQDYEQRQQVISQGMEQYASQSQEPRAKSQEYNTDEFVRLTDGTYGTITNVTPEGYEITADNGTTKMVAQTDILPEKQISGMIPGDTINYIDDNGDQQQGIIQIDPTLRKEGKVLVNDQEVSIENIIPLQETKTGDNGDGGNTEQKTSYPTLKDGTPDFNSMNDEQVYAYTKETKGEEAAQALIGRQVKRLQGQISDNQRATNSLKEETNKLLSKAKNMQEEAAIEAKQETKGLALKQQHEDLTAKLVSAQSYLPKTSAPVVVETPKVPNTRPEILQLQKQEAERLAKELADQTPVIETPTEVQPKSITGWHTTKDEGSESSTQIQSSGLPVGKFVALDKPFTSTYHKKENASRVTVNVQNTYNPDGKKGFQKTEDLSDEMVKYVNTHKELRFEQAMTNFYKSKGYDSYVRDIDGIEGNRELIVFDESKIQNEKPIIEEIPKENLPEQTTKGTTPFQKRQQELGEYLDMEDYILRAIAGGQKFKWKTEGVKKGMADELGFGDKNGERLQRRNLIDEQNGLTPTEFAHAIWNDYGEDGNGGEIPGVRNLSDHEILNLVNEILLSTKSNSHALEQAEAKRNNYDLNQQDYGVYESFTPEELNYLEQIPDDILESYLGITNFTPEQLDFITNIQNEYETSINQKSADTSASERDKRTQGQEPPTPRGEQEPGQQSGTEELTRERFFNLTTAENFEQFETNVAEILQQYSGRGIAALQVKSYLSENKDTYGNEYLSKYGIKTKEQLDEFLGKLQTKLRTGKGKERSQVLKELRNERTEQSVSEIEQMALEAEAEMQEAIKQQDTKELDDYISEQEHNTNPTEKQKETGIYAKARVNLQHHNITIETLKGTERTGEDEGGQKWSVTMQNHYGELDGTIGYDNDPIDVFIGPNPKQGQIFVIDQISPDGSFDESKVMLGFDSAEEAKAAYMSNYSEGWDGFKSITPAGDNFKEWLYDGKKQKKPFAEYKDTPEAVKIQEQTTIYEPDNEKLSDTQNNTTDNKQVDNIKNAESLQKSEQPTSTERYNNSTKPEERHAAAVEIVRGLEKTLHVGTTPAQVMKSTDDFLAKYKSMVSDADYQKALKYLQSGQQIAAVRLGKDLFINIEHNEDAAELADSYLHETAHKAFEIAFQGEDLSTVEIPNIEKYIPSVYWGEDSAMKATEVAAHQVSDLLNNYTPEQIKNGEIDLSLLDEDVQYLVSKTLNKITHGKISIIGQEQFNDLKSIPGSSGGIQANEHAGNDGIAEVGSHQPDNGKPGTERERILREKLAKLGGKLGLKPEFKRTIENILLNGKETGTKIITEQPKKRISFIRSVRNDNLPTSKLVWREKGSIKSPTGHVDFDLKNIHVSIYREASETVQNIQELRKNYLFLERNRKGEPVMDLPKAKIFSEGFNYEIEEFARVLSAVKNHSTEPAQQVINDTLESIQVAKKYYEDLADGKDVWRTDPEPQFKRLDSETTDIALDVTEMLFEDGDITFPDYSARMIEALGEGIKPYLSGFYELSRVSIPTQGMTSNIEVANFDIKNFNYKEHVSNRSRHSQPDSTTTDEVPGDAKPIPVDGGTSGSVGNGIKKGSGKTIGRTGSKSRGDLQPSLFGEQSNNELLPGTSEVEKFTTGDTDGRGNGIDSTEGHLINGGSSEPGNKIDVGLPETFKQRTVRKIIEQRNAESIPVTLMDEANVRETLPLLLPEQQDDVLKAEKRFFGEEHKTNEAAHGKGMLFTNGTGTGKTYTGLGVAKRFEKRGKKNILIVVPSEAKVGDWIKDGENIGLTIIPLTSTKDAGENAVITTYANFRANDALKNRDFDLVMYDESHRLMEEKSGATSSTTNSHYSHSNVSEWQAFNRLQSINPDYIKIQELFNRINEEKKTPGNLNVKSLEEKVLQLQKAYNENIKPGLKERAKRAYENTKVVFLSATPFKGHFNLRYANGSLFDWGNDTIVNGRGSRVNPEAQFFLNNFGSAYEWKFHRLQTKQKANAEAIAMQEIDFSERLMAQGVMSGRAIESDKDYSREFPLVALEQSEVFNKALNEIYSEEFGGLADAAHNVFSDYNYTTKLFESLKASMNIQRIQDHLDLGRKVIVFHRRKQANVLPPFQSILDQTRELANGYIAEMAQTDDLVKKAELALKANTMRTQAKQFENKYADLLKYEQTLNYDPAINQINEAFPGRVVSMNGDTPKKDKSKNVALFNEDHSGKDIIVVQEEAGKEGISLHDTTGKHQRVLISLSLPISSTTALQIEGRPYRIGNESDAIFEYPLLGLDQEVADFGQKINKKLSTTENLAIGNQARDLLRSFAEGVLFNSGKDKPNISQGKGGKEYDKKAQETLSEFRKAVLVYNTNQKTTGRRDQREGADYYATPEPVGEKMVEWLSLQAGESALEPSAGHGAIAMWFPEKASVTVVEPSYSLFSKLNARSGGGNRKMLNDVFENLNTVNKFEGIAMNPPFGSGGKTAIEHLNKAYDHLRNNGRIVAIIPQGQADKRLDDFLEGTPDAHLIASVKLPSSTFEQAGTKVGTRIVVIDRIDMPTEWQVKQEVKAEEYKKILKGGVFYTPEEMQTSIQKKMSEYRNAIPSTENIDLSGAKNIDELFNEIEDLEVTPRQLTKTGDNNDGVDNVGDSNISKEPITENKAEGKLMPVEDYTHTQTGQQLYNVKINGRSDDYDTMAAIGRKHNPYGGGRPWNKFSKGFLFSDRDNAVKFKNEVEKGPLTYKWEQERPEYKLISDNGFYSPVENALDKIQQERGTKDQFKAMLLKNGAKQAELDWMGFDELPEKLTKSDVQNWIDENRIDVKEVIKGDKIITAYDVFNDINDFVGEYNNISDAEYYANINGGYFEPSIDEKRESDAIFSQYVLPGGKNYKELLLTMPKNESNAGELHLVHKENGMWAWYRGTHQDTGAFRTREQAEGAISQIRPESKFDTSNFHSSHYEEPNILAHVRFNERTVNGEKVLFIEEFQSDWAQKGKKEGFSDPKLIQRKNEIQAEMKSLRQDLDVLRDKDAAENNNGKRREANLLEWAGKYEPEKDSQMAALLSELNSIEEDSVPDMPFQKTDQWVNLAARRMMRYAAENGFDRIAWTNGTQQAERYDLSKQVDKITITKDEMSDAINKQGERVQGYVVSAVKGTDRIIRDETMDISHIEETLGKEIAKGVIEGKETFEGDGLKVGGKGMEAFYDAIVPKVMSKLGKPFDAKIETIGLNTKIKKTNEEISFSQFEKEAKMPEVSQVQSIPVTDSMKQSVSEGIPMFKRKEPLTPEGEPVKPTYSVEKPLEQYATEINAYNDKIKAINDRKKELKKEHDDKKISNIDFVSEARKLNDEKFDLETKKKRIEAGTSTPEDFEETPLTPPESGINGGGQKTPPPTTSRSTKLAEEVGENLPEKLRDELDAKMERGMKKIEFAIQEAYQDQHLAVKLFQDKLKENGLVITPLNDWHRRVSALGGMNDSQMDAYEHRFNLPIMKEVNRMEKISSYRDIENYMMLKHGLERNDFMRAQEAAALEADGKNIPEGLAEKDFSGITAIEEEIKKPAQEFIDEFEGLHDTTKLWDLIKKSTTNALKVGNDNGRISKTEYDDIVNRFKYYIPLRGFDKDIAEDKYDYSPDMGTHFVAPLIKAKGRISRPETPFAYIFSMNHSAITEGNKNNLNQIWVRLARQDKSGLLILKQSWYKKTGETENGLPIWEQQSPEWNANPEQYDLNIQKFEADMQELAEKKEAIQKRGKLNIGLFVKPKQAKQHEIHVYENGTEHVVYINANPKIARAINGDNRVEAGAFFDGLSVVNRWMAANFTSRNPLFMVTNFERDITFATTTLGVKEGIIYQANFLKNVPVAVKAITNMMIGTGNVQNKYDQYAEEFVMNGGKTGYTHIVEIKSVQKRIENEIKKGKINEPSVVFRLFELGNSVAENTTRLATYITSREAGRSIYEAVSNAKEVTVNFNTKGSGALGADEMRKSFLFFNVAIQALSNILKTTKEHPWRMAGLLASFVATGILMPLLSRLLGGEEAEQAYNNLSDWDRQNNLCIWTGSGYVKWSIPQELRVFHALGDNLYRFSQGKVTKTELAVNTMVGLTDLLPVNPMGAMKTDGKEWKMFANTLTPDLMKPWVQLAINTTYTGGNVFNPYANPSDPGFVQSSKNKKGEPYAPAILVWAAQEMDKQSDGDGVMPGKISPNPDVINHIMRGYMGGLYTIFVKSVDSGDKVIEGKELKVRDTPISALYTSKEDIKESDAGLRKEYSDVKAAITDEKHYISKYKSGAIEIYRKGGDLAKVAEYTTKMQQLSTKKYTMLKFITAGISKLEEQIKDAQDPDVMQQQINKFKKIAIRIDATKDEKELEDIQEEMSR